MDKIITNINILHQISKETTLEEVTKLNLIERLKEANNHAWTDGCGLASIQIGIPLCFSWIRFDNKEYTLLNPEIIFKRGKYTYHNEGCLSIPNNYVDTERYLEIEYLNNGKKQRAKGQKAVIIQHEIDHMNGILNIERKQITLDK